jgi:hypothetical protein
VRQRAVTSAIDALQSPQYLHLSSSAAFCLTYSSKITDQITCCPSKIMSSTASQLPQELWVQILQYVPNYQRLSACALVCRKLARAAASATTSVELTASQRCAAFLSHWVSSYGSSLTRLHLSADDSSIRDLPCPALLELSLHGGHVQLCAGNEGVGLLHSCTALTRLSLLYPTLLDDGVLMPARGVPSAVAQLRHLALQYAGPAAPDGESKLAQALQHRLLPHLTALTCFQLKNKYGCSGHLVSCFLQHVSTMNRLQRLLVWNAGEGSVSCHRDAHICMSPGGSCCMLCA